jgi:hypothetical protein
MQMYRLQQSHAGMMLLRMESREELEKPTYTTTVPSAVA